MTARHGAVAGRGDDDSDMHSTDEPDASSPRAFGVLFAARGAIAIVGASLALVSCGVSGGVTDAPTTPTAPTVPTATTAPASTSAPAPPSLTSAPAPTAAPGAPADPCHVGGITYCALNAAVSPSTIHQTICVSGWTATVRPPESYTEDLKREQIAQEGLPGGLSSYEEDHRMPLELGGAPSDAMNLSPESPRSPNPKDTDETRLKTAVCDGQLTLMQAQQQLVATWLAPYPRYKQ